MQGCSTKDISIFFVAGINYKKTDAAIRGQYAVNNDQYAALLSVAPLYGITELFILSTCNRTEIYGFAEDPSKLIGLLCTQTAGSEKVFSELAYIKKGVAAIEHLFNVGAGLDSQILGDYEIVGQLKKAVSFSRQHCCIGSFLDRLVSVVLQCSKAIKNGTNISNGTVSVSFAAIQYIRETYSNLSGKSILLVGTGKLGRSTGKNLVDYLNTSNITLINRTASKASALAKELGLKHASHQDLPRCIQSADIIIVATNANQPTIQRSHLEDAGRKLILDLSIPYNVEPSSRHLPNVTLVNVDELSKIKDETIKSRQAEIPRVKAIISAHIAELFAWNEMRKHVPVLQAVKSKLHEINARHLPIPVLLSPQAIVIDPSEKIQRVINVMAGKMRRHNKPGCHFIEAINDLMAPAQLD